MVVAERNSLTPVKVLISNSLIHLELLENKEGGLFLSCGTDEPEGVVYYATGASSLCSFMEGRINLQTLFEKSPSLFVEIINKDNASLYSRNDIKIKLKSGDKTIRQLTDGQIEIWSDEDKNE